MSSIATVVLQPGRRVTRSSTREMSREPGNINPNPEIGVTIENSHSPIRNMSCDLQNRFSKEDIRHYGKDDDDTQETGNRPGRSLRRGYRSANETLTGDPKTETRTSTRSPQRQSSNNSDSFSETEEYQEDITLGPEGQQELTKFLDEMNIEEAKPLTRPS